VSILPLPDITITCDVFPLTMSFLSRLPDAREGVSVGCIDFSLMPEAEQLHLEIDFFLD
jgi:hypothetical protein